MSISSRPGGSRASDDDGRTSVKVGMFSSAPYILFFLALVLFATILFKCREKHCLHYFFSPPLLYRMVFHETRAQ